MLQYIKNLMYHIVEHLDLELFRIQETIKIIHIFAILMNILNVY